MPEEIMTVGQFITVVAKHKIEKKYAGAIRDWPDNNYWAMVSTERLKIDKDELPGLMKLYNIDTLAGYTQYFGEIPQENAYENRN